MVGKRYGRNKESVYEIKSSVNLLEMEEIRDFIRNAPAPRVGFR